MSWESFSLHFKQVFDGGYKYLDSCGSLMLLAEERLGLMTEDVKPSGCKMIIDKKSLFSRVRYTIAFQPSPIYTRSNRHDIAFHDGHCVKSV
jgi:hypothetical protein